MANLPLHPEKNSIHSAHEKLMRFCIILCHWNPVAQRHKQRKLTLENAKKYCRIGFLNRQSYFAYSIEKSARLTGAKNMQMNCPSGGWRIGVAFSM